MGLLEIAGVAALVLIAGESRMIPSEDGLNLGRMKQACAIAAAEEFDTVQGLLVFEDHAIRQSNGSYRLEGVADGKMPFVCVFNDRGHFNSVRKR